MQASQVRKKGDWQGGRLDARQTQAAADQYAAACGPMLSLR